MGLWSAMNTVAKLLKSVRPKVISPSFPSFRLTSNILYGVDTLHSTRAFVTSYLEAFRANPSPAPDNVPEKTTNATSGPLPSTAFASYDPDESFWRTCQGFSPPDEAMAECVITGEYSETWPRAGTLSSGVCFRQPKWERRISEIDSGSLAPTPSVPNGGRQNDMSKLHFDGRTLRREDDTKVQVGLEIYVRLWPTPTVDSAEDRDKKYAQGGTPLVVAVKQWPTPTVNGNRNFKGSSPKAGDGLETAALESYATPQARDWRHGSQDRWKGGHKRVRSNNLNDQVGGKLNADWVEWLMGWPVGWTSLAPMAAEQWEEWRRMSLGGSWWAEEPAAVPRLVMSMTLATSRATAKVRKARLRALGNGQVPHCAAAAFLLLISKDGERDSHSSG